jgi:CBS domain containing-hemolysin-like protein
VLDIDEEMFDDIRGEAETLAGLILELTGEIPQKDKTITVSDFVFKIESADKRRIKEVRVEYNKSKALKIEN